MTRVHCQRRFGGSKIYHHHLVKSLGFSEPEKMVRDLGNVIVYPNQCACETLVQAIQ